MWLATSEIESYSRNEQLHAYTGSLDYLVSFFLVNDHKSRMGALRPGDYGPPFTKAIARSKWAKPYASNFSFTESIGILMECWVPDLHLSKAFELD